MDRRKFLKYGGATIAGLTLGNYFGDKLFAKHINKNGWEGPYGEEKYEITFCTQCPAGCGMNVKVSDGFPTTATGNSSCPIAQGKLCPKGVAAPYLMYDPDRWVAPVIRENPFSSPWQKVSWEKALATFADALKKLQDSGREKKLMWLMSDEHSSFTLLVRKFMRAFGSPNLFTIKNDRDPAAKKSNALMFNASTYPIYDIENASLILSFGTPFLENWGSPTFQHRAYSRLRDPSSGLRGQFIHVEPRFSPTAIKADIWLANKPGTEGYVALGIAYVLVKERMYNSKFISKHCRDFGDFRDLILKNVSPQKIEEISGIPYVQIRKVAHMFARAKNPLAIAERRPFSNGLFASCASLSLNLLVGSVNQKGGLLTDNQTLLREFWEDELLATQEHTSLEDNLTSLDDLAEVIASNPEKRPAVVVISDSRCLSGIHGKSSFLKAIREVPLVVSLSPYKDDSSYSANLVLPDHTFLEKWQDRFVFGNTMNNAYTCSKPLAKPLLNTMDKADTIIRVASLLGGRIQKTMQQKNHQDAIRSTAKRFFDSGRASSGKIFGEKNLPDNFEDFFLTLVKNGGWYEQSSARPTPRANVNQLYSFATGELFSKELWKGPQKADEQKGYPYTLYPFDVLSLSSIGNQNQPLLQEIVTQLVDGAWTVWCEINPKTAEKERLRNGESAILESPLGKLEVKVCHYEGIPEDAIGLFIGNESLDGGRWARKGAIAPADLLPFKSDEGEKYPLSIVTKVKLTKIG
ncbi:MAG: hypothetical protein D6808_06605 [Candidatus Dadabacteria bacterium]|nr:MAG: hypothetical protein D6808_06605 [Candidatus Dadabacteria bacterium]